MKKIFALIMMVLSNSVFANCEDEISKIKDGSSIIEALNCINSKNASPESSVVNLPIGTVISSILSPDIFEQQYGSDWILADGSRLATTSKYFEVTGDTRVPDLRGVFLRGVNGNRADGKGDTSGNARKVGTYQDYSTALPRTNFTGKTAVSGEHTHNYSRARSYDAGAGGHDRAKASGNTGTTAASGKHAHDFSVTKGGDEETRPKNVAVYFYIKVE